MSEERTPNAEQIKAWDGPDGDTWTDNEAFYVNSSKRLTPYLFNAAAIAADDRVLDVGCGTGATTRDAARAAKGGSALGIDLSTRMLERARERAREEGLDNVRFERGDAQVYPFEPGAFTVAMSRFGVMFFDDPEGAFTNIARGVAQGGRLAMLVWRDFARNDWLTAIRDALVAGRTLPDPPPTAPSPVALADPDRVHGILSAAGWSGVTLDPVDEKLYFGPAAESTFEQLQKIGIVVGLLSELDDRSRTDALEKLRQTIAERETPDGVLFDSSAWLVCAVKPG